MNYHKIYTVISNQSLKPLNHSCITSVLCYVLLDKPYNILSLVKYKVEQLHKCCPFTHYKNPCSFSIDIYFIIHCFHNSQSSSSFNKTNKMHHWIEDVLVEFKDHLNKTK